MRKKTYYWLILVFIAIGLVVIIDLSIGVFYEKLAPDFGKQNLTMALNEHKGDSLRLAVQPHPYLTYVNTPFYNKNGFRQHNNMGYRNIENTRLSKPSHCFRILVMGGSTTYGDGVDNPGDTWPHILQKMLNDNLGLMNDDLYVEVINAGMPWATSAELLNHYLYKNRNLHADLVVLHTGGNDIQPRAFDNYKPDYSHWRSIQGGGKNGLKPGEAWLVSRSNIVKLLYALWYNNLDYAVSRPYIHTKEYTRLSADEIRENLNKNTNASFTRNVSLLLRNIQNDGAVPVYFQFYASEASVDKNVHGTKRKKWVREQHMVLRKAFYENRDSAFNICSENNIMFLEMSPDNVPEHCMVDICHMNHVGHKIKARFVAEKLMPLLKKHIRNVKCQSDATEVNYTE